MFTGKDDRGGKRRYRAYKRRIQTLPAAYREGIQALERYLFVFGPGQGDRVLAMLEDLGDLFEQAASQGASLRSVVGEDPVEFAETFARNYPEGGWVTKERTRLTEAIDRAAGESR